VVDEEQAKWGNINPTVAEVMGLERALHYAAERIFLKRATLNCNAGSTR